MNRKLCVGLCLATLPIVWGLAGCGGGDGAGVAKQPAKTPTVTEGGAGKAADKGGEKAEPVKTESSKAEAAPAGEGWGGIKGQVVFGGDQIPEPTLIVKKGDPAAKDPAVCAVEDIFSQELVVNKDNKGLRWVLVYIGGKPAVHPDMKQAEGTVELGQKFCSFRPHVVALRHGQKFLITSDDPVAHNTKGDCFKNPGFNPTVPPAPEGGRSELAGPDLDAEPRPFPISCGIHPWMKAYMGVFDHPYYAVTDENGNFEIKNIPAGSQKLVVWQEKFGWGEGAGKGKDITVKAGDTTDLGQLTFK